jgi:hypothetical protein
MTNIIPIHPAQAHVVEVDDSRLQTLWTRHHRRNLLLAGGAVVTGLLLGAAVLIMALRMNNEPPKVEVAMPPITMPTINIPAPVVNVAPQIEVKMPPTAPLIPNVNSPETLRNGESKVVTEYEVFHTATVEGRSVVTGWKYRSSTDSKPSVQHCYVRLDATTVVELAEDGKLEPNLDRDASRAGLDPTTARRYAGSCRWHG